MHEFLSLCPSLFLSVSLSVCLSQCLSWCVKETTLKFFPWFICIQNPVPEHLTLQSISIIIATQVNIGYFNRIPFSKSKKSTRWKRENKLNWTTNCQYKRNAFLHIVFYWSTPTEMKCGITPPQQPLRSTESRRPQPSILRSVWTCSARNCTPHTRTETTVEWRKRIHEGKGNPFPKSTST